VDIDEMLLNEAALATGIRDPSALLREALKALIERESSRRLIALAGSEPALKRTPRRRNR
jgi:hypothetical protein